MSGVSLQTTIHSLADRRWSHRRIPRELGINRETVGRHLRLAGTAKPAILPRASRRERNQNRPFRPQARVLAGRVNASPSPK